MNQKENKNNFNKRLIDKGLNFIEFEKGPKEELKKQGKSK